jgi:hypothetical protein
MFFKIKCYINYIKDNTINISINDPNELLRFQKNLIKLYKNPEYFDYEKKKFSIKILNTTKIQLNTNYNLISDLHGISVIISGSSKYYCFSVDNEVFDEQTNLLKTEKKVIRGYTLYANKIINDTSFYS